MHTGPRATGAVATKLCQPAKLQRGVCVCVCVCVYVHTQRERERERETHLVAISRPLCRVDNKLNPKP
jgi:hypothetical protein